MMKNKMIGNIIKHPPQLTEEELEKRLREASKRKEIAGTIIEYTINVEYYLSEVLKIYFVENPLKQAKFVDLVLSKEFFTFEEKRKVLKKLKFEDNGDYNFEEIVHSDLRYIQEIRNQLAHSLRKYDEKRGCFKIEYIRDGKKKEIFLNEEFIKEFSKRALRAEKNLFRLEVDLNYKTAENSKEQTNF